MSVVAMSIRGFSCESGRRRCFALAGAILLSPVPLPGLAQEQDPCNRDVKPVEGPYRYKARQEPLRCEGFHEVKVTSGTPIYMAHLVATYEPYEPGSNEPITIQWRSQSPSTLVRLQVISIPGRIDAAYRMDANVAGSDVSFEWPIDFLRVRRISLDALGIRAWARAEVGGTERVVHLPLHVYQGEPPAAHRQLTIGVITRMTIADALLTVTRVDEDDFTVDVEPLRKGTHGALSLVSFALPELAEGVYRADFSARSGRPSAEPEPVSLRFWFYHSGD